MANYRVLVSNLMMLKFRERFQAELENRGIDAVFPEAIGQSLTEAQMLAYAGNFDGLLCGDDQITRQVIKAHLPRLKVIAKWGTGLDSIDLDAAKELGVPVYNSPGAFKNAVAEIALAYMLDLSRQIRFTDSQVRQGNWVKPIGEGLMDKTVAIIGFGAIGQGIAARANAFNMSVIAYDPVPPTNASELNVKLMALEDLLPNADYIVLSCNMTHENIGLVNANTISKMKDGVKIINVSRGPLIRDSDLIAALQSGKVSGAGLDVFEKEPLDLDHPYTAMENVILGTHNANNVASVNEYVHQNTLNNLFKGLGIKTQ
jgi:D-3-phosphoglycerate dehydrogenase